MGNIGEDMQTWSFGALYINKKNYEIISRLTSNARSSSEAGV